MGDKSGEVYPGFRGDFKICVNVSYMQLFITMGLHDDDDDDDDDGHHECDVVSNNG